MVVGLGIGCWMVVSVSGCVSSTKYRRLQKLNMSLAAERESALQDLRVRRLGLIASVAIILMFILALFLKIRQIESGPADSPGRA